MLFTIDEDAILAAYTSLNRTKEQVEEDVATVTEWLKNQPHLPEIMNKNSIRNFLLLNKFSIEKTKIKIDWYYTIRSLEPDVFRNANPNSLEKVQKAQDFFLVLHPKLYNNMYRVYFCKVMKTGKYYPEFSLCQIFNLFELRLLEDHMLGEIIVFDFQHFGVKDFANVTPTLLLKYFKIYEKVYSLRAKKIYLINDNGFLTTILSYIKAIVKPKILQRIFTCENDEILKTDFDNDFLPEDYGGNGPSLQSLNEMLQAEFVKNNSRFEALETMAVDESLRPEELKNDEHFGFYGNFKKLNVD